MDRESTSTGFTSPRFINPWSTNQKSISSGSTDSGLTSPWFIGLKTAKQRSNS
jgi:hypothetical protein